MQSKLPMPTQSATRTLTRSDGPEAGRVRPLPRSLASYGARKPGKHPSNNRSRIMPDLVISRLPAYLRVLSALEPDGTAVFSSAKLASELGITPDTVRKDLNYLGRFGRRGFGYHAGELAAGLRRVLGLDHIWEVAIVGVGRVGRAIITYPGFELQGFRFAAAFDFDPSVIGSRVGNLVVQPLSMVGSVIPSADISIAVVTVPASCAQHAVDELTRAGIRAILNYAPITLEVADDVVVRDIDPVRMLQSMTYHLRG